MEKNKNSFFKDLGNVFKDHFPSAFKNMKEKTLDFVDEKGPLGLANGLIKLMKSRGATVTTAQYSPEDKNLPEVETITATGKFGENEIIVEISRPVKS